jgi:hypothetical protein
MEMLFGERPMWLPAVLVRLGVGLLIMALNLGFDPLEAYKPERF